LQHPEIRKLQHPEIRKDESNRNESNNETTSPQFDVLIIDEASKTTFQEFLVPAWFAERWVLVGDPKQLSPYVEDDFTAINLRPCLPEEFERNSCADVFYASSDQIAKHKTGLICSESSKEIEFYHQQAKKHGALICTTSNISQLPYADLIIDSAKSIEKNAEYLPLDITYIRDKNESLSPWIHYRVAAYNRLKNSERDSAPIWENEVAWRIARLYEQRHSNEVVKERIDVSIRRRDTLTLLQNPIRLTSNQNRTAAKLDRDIQKLLPFYDTDDKIDERINNVKRIALPSILESLQDGFDRNKNQRTGMALTDGFPKDALQKRHIRLSAQHRMHPDIACFPREHIYNNSALETAKDMIKKREWSYQPNQNRVIWFDIRSKHEFNNSNNEEARAILTELEKFDHWAGANPKSDGREWQVAILTFYRGQERAIRNELVRWTKNYNAVRHFKSKNKVEMQICTVDKFQGHEADYVLLSFVKNHPTSFLESPNRLNVAITRARYKLKIFGNVNAMRRASGVLGLLAERTPVEQKV